MVSSLILCITLFGVGWFDSERNVDRPVPADAHRVLVEGAHGDCLVFPTAAGTEPRAMLTISATGTDSQQERDFLDKVDLEVQVIGRGEYKVVAAYPPQDLKPPELSFAARLQLWLPTEVEIEVENRFGAVEITGRNAAVTVRNRLGPVVVRDIDGTTSVTNEYDKVSATGIRGNLKISTSAEVEVDSVQGTVDVVNKFGTVTLVNIRGPVTVENRNAPIVLREVEGPCIITAPYCAVTAEGIDTNLRVDGNNERVVAIRIGGDVEIKHRHGELHLEEIGGGVIIQGHFNPTLLHKIGGNVNLICPASSVDVDFVAGDASLEVMAGSLKIKDVQGSLIARGQGGLMSVTCAIPLQKTGAPRIYDLENRNSPIELHLAMESSCKISAQSTLGTIECDFPGFRIEKSGRIATGTCVLGEGDVAVRAICVDSLIRIDAYHEE